MDESSTVTDETLLQRAGRGDEEAFGLLYDRFSGRLYALVSRILENENAARDALKDGFVHLWEKAATFDPAKSRAFPWSVVIFRNRAVERVRASRRRVQFDDAVAEELLPLKGADASRAIGQGAGGRASVVREAFGSLPEQERKTIECAFLKGFTQHQVAELFGQPLGTVKANIRSGLLGLRELLKGGES